MTKPKPKYTERERDFLDMAAIHLMAAYVGAFPKDHLFTELADTSFSAAEALLAERAKRL